MSKRIDGGSKDTWEKGASTLGEEGRGWGRGRGKDWGWVFGEGLRVGEELGVVVGGNPLVAIYRLCDQGKRNLLLSHYLSAYTTIFQRSNIKHANEHNITTADTVLLINLLSYVVFAMTISTIYIYTQVS